MRESPMELSRVELCIGDSVRIEGQILTVLDISEDEVTFRIDTATDLEANDVELEDIEFGAVVCHGDSGKRLPPR